MMFRVHWLTIANIALIALLVYAVGFSDFAKERDAKNAAKEKAERTPHVIREADGCKVYAFKAGENYHYFTRCPDSTTTTDTTITKCNMVGKVSQCKDEVSSIVESK